MITGFNYQRYNQTERVIRTLALLTSRGYTRRELAKTFKVSVKTIWRDLFFIEHQLLIPVKSETCYEDDVDNEYLAGQEMRRYKIEKCFLRRFL